MATRELEIIIEPNEEYFFVWDLEFEIIIEKNSKYIVEWDDNEQYRGGD